MIPSILFEYYSYVIRGKVSFLSHLIGSKINAIYELSLYMYNPYMYVEAFFSFVIVLVFGMVSEDLSQTEMMRDEVVLGKLKTKN